MTPLRIQIRERREALGLSQQALGNAAGVRQATISDLESGKSQGIDFKTLERLAKALHVEPGSLIVRESKKRG